MAVPVGGGLAGGGAEQGRGELLHVGAGARGQRGDGGGGGGGAHAVLRDLHPGGP